MSIFIIDYGNDTLQNQIISNVAN